MEQCEYRVRQKECSKFSNEKSLVFSVVNLLENLHVSTYTIYVGMHIKSQKNRGGYCAATSRRGVEATKSALGRTMQKYTRKHD